MQGVLKWSSLASASRRVYLLSKYTTDSTDAKPGEIRLMGTGRYRLAAKLHRSLLRKPDC